MSNTYTCDDCGYTADCGAGDGPSLCPECGGNNLAMKRARKPASPATAPAAPATPPAEEGQTDAPEAGQGEGQTED